MNPLQQLYSEYGQSIWLDFISRKILDSGELARLAGAGEIRGVTSNPAIFEKSISEGVDYAPFIAELRAKNAKATAFELYEALAVRDIQAACDVLAPLYAESKTRDGYVSLEVTMQEGESTRDILDEAHRLWKKVARPNVMIKVPGTKDGIAAFETLISEGINVNVTLLFSLDVYTAVAKAYIAGIDKRVKKGGDVSKVASVASFFVSRIDSNVDKQLDDKIAASKSEKDKTSAKKVQGKVAIANAKLAYVRYKELFSGKKWDALAAKGASTQRVLWASTGTKNKKYSDVLYIEELLGPHTVNTAPPATIDAFRDHGKPRPSLEEDVRGAEKVLADLEKLGVSLEKVTDTLLDEGVKIFSDAFAKLLVTLDAKPVAPDFTFTAPKEIQTGVQAVLDDWKKRKSVERLWARDAKLWTNADEARWLGWLDAPAAARASATDLAQFAAEVRKDGLKHVLLLGMGGSSLCPEVLKRTFGSSKDFPVLEVLDSTDPAQVAAIEKKVDLTKTLVVVSSKSGSTLEPNIFEAYFWDRVSCKVGERNCGKRFVAITDPGSKLEALAKRKGYRRIFPGEPSIGGRFSALSFFGLVPAALIGVDMAQFGAKATEMAERCGAKSAADSNPGVQLGALMGVAAKNGRDKLTLVVSPKIAGLGAWLEQLIAESTGKNGKGIIPVDLEPLGAPSVYGKDRLFVYVRLASGTDKAQDAAVSALEKAGHAVARISVPDPIALSAEFFRFEIATAVAGAILELNPFDQPDVEASKLATRALTDAYEKSGTLPPEKPFFEEDGFTVYGDAKYARAIHASTGPKARLEDVLSAHLERAKPGDYVALLAYVEMNDAHAKTLTAMRTQIRDTRKLATCVGFGPRFLHSTGQAYKGGPNSGVFLQITCADAADVPVPGAKYTFGVVEAAQARGDFQVLVERGRRALRVHLTGDVRKGLERLSTALASALEKSAAVRS